MGLGIGEYCEACDVQLTYDHDAEEIVARTKIDEDGERIVTSRPLLCHRCQIVLDWMEHRIARR
jgi:hypothetical protein